MTVAEAQAEAGKRRGPTTANYAMPAQMIEAVKQRASEREISASAFVREAISRHLVEAAVEAEETPPLVRLPSGDQRPLVELRPVMVSGTSSLNKDNACYGGGSLVFWRPITPRMLRLLQPRLARLVAALHVEEKQRRNGGQT